MKIAIGSMPLFDLRKRHVKLAGLAQAHGYPIIKSMRFKVWKEDFPKFKLFRKKTDKKIRNIISFPQTDLEGHIQVFDFLYTDDDMDYKRTTALLFESRALQLPEFQIKPKGLQAILEKLFLTEDKLFPNYPQFSKQYKVVGKDRRAIRYAIKPEIFPILTADHKWTLEGQGNFLLLYRNGKSQKPQQLLDFYATGLEFCHQMIHGDSNDYV